MGIVQESSAGPASAAPGAPSSMTQAATATRVFRIMCEPPFQARTVLGNPLLIVNPGAKFLPAEEKPVIMEKMPSVDSLQENENPSQVAGTEVGARIKRLRKAAKLTQSEVAEPQFSASYLSVVESGQRQPTQKMLEHIGQRLGIDPEELLTGRSRREEMGLDLQLQEAREHLRLGDLDGAARLAQSVAERARTLGLGRLEARSCELLGSIEERHGQAGDALTLYQRAEERWRSESMHLAFETKAGLARCHLALGDPRLAVHLLESYLLELQTEGVPDPTATMRAHSTLVICYSALGFPEKAADAAEKAQALSPRVLDPEQLACMRMNVARSLYEQGHMNDALDAIRSAEQAYLTLGWQLDAAGAKLNRAIVRMDRGDLDSARVDLKEALGTYKNAKQSVDVARTLNELGRLERIAGRPDEGIAFLREAQEHLSNGDFSERALNLRELGMCLQETSPNEAKSHLRRAIDLHILAGSDRDVAKTYKLLGDLHSRDGDVEASAQAYRAGIEALE